MILAIYTAAVVLIDQSSKALINTHLRVGESFPLISGVLHLTHVKNSGAAFGLMQGRQILFLATAIVLVVVLLVFYKRIKGQEPWMKFALGLVLGGAVGNLIDRVSTGEVTDFIDIRIWPVFNIADSSIVVGVALLGILLLFEPKGDQNCGLADVTENGSKILNKEKLKSTKPGKTVDCSTKGIEADVSDIV